MFVVVRCACLQCRKDDLLSLEMHLRLKVVVFFIAKLRYYGWLGIQMFDVIQLK